MPDRAKRMDCLFAFRGGPVLYLFISDGCFIGFMDMHKCVLLCCGVHNSLLCLEAGFVLCLDGKMHSICKLYERVLSKM